MTLTLVLGGARSGKSGYAQRMAHAYAQDRRVVPTFIATATPGDGEMADRIARHQADRGEAWRTLETPLALPERLAELTSADVAVIDCLTLWLSNAMATLEGDAPHAERLIPSLKACDARLWVVSNEVGWGIVPDNALARAFRDAAGRLHQDIAAFADETVLIVAGLPVFLKP